MWERIDNKKRNILILLVIFILMISFASGEFWACFGYGELIDYCNPRTPDRTCSQTSIPCIYCMDSYNEQENCYNQGNWRVCNSMPMECNYNPNSTVDSEPPNMTINSPIQGVFYDSRAVFVNIYLDEVSSLYYLDNINGRGKWDRLCSGCVDYSRSLNFDEGKNNVTFRARDKVGNTDYQTIVFYIDSKEPRIYSTEPEGGEYGNGQFSVRYTEEALQSISFYYQINGGDWQSIEKTNCPAGEKVNCIFDIDLEGEFSLTYYFGVTDSAQTIFSDKETIFVDTMAPVMDVISPHNPSWIYNKKVPIDIEVGEEVTIEYIDYFDSRPKWKKLCSRCFGYDKTKSFSDGEHNVDFKATDRAGNFVTVNREFFVDSKEPKISKTGPRRGFASGIFDVEFREENPEELVLYYGSDSYVFDIENECFEDRRKHRCSTTINLDSYDGEEVDYHAELTDIVGNKDISRAFSLEIDMTFPVIDSIDYEIKGSNKAEVIIDVNEGNLDKITYINHNDRRPKEKKFCSKLGNDRTCKKKIKLNEGMNSIDFQVIDKAGNSVGENIEIFVS